MKKNLNLIANAYEYIDKNNKENLQYYIDELKQIDQYVCKIYEIVEMKIKDVPDGYILMSDRSINEYDPDDIVEVFIKRDELR